MFEKLFGLSRPSRPSTLIQSAVDDVCEMLRTSRRMLELSLAALLDNQPLDADLDAMDDAVDEGERMVRRSVLEHLSFDPRKDLVLSLVLVSMVQDAERTGDFAIGLAELVPLTGKRREGPFRDELATTSKWVLPMFGQCEKVFQSGDREGAQQLIDRAAEVRRALTDYIRRVAASDLSADLAVVYSSAARSLRRVVAHLSNIASAVTQPYDRILHEDEGV